MTKSETYNKTEIANALSVQGLDEWTIKEVLDRLPVKSNIHPGATEVLNYLNELAKRRFSARRSNLSNINARLQEGITVQQLKQVIELKVFQWANDFTMKAHLNPETLFRPSKIEKYLQEVEDIEKNPQKFKQHVERNHQEEQRQRDRNFNPLA